MFLEALSPRAQYCGRVELKLIPDTPGSWCQLVEEIGGIEGGHGKEGYFGHTAASAQCQSQLLFPGSGLLPSISNDKAM